MRVENNNVSGQNHDPEQIDLIDLLVQLWRGKMTIIISVIVAIALAIGYLAVAKEKWTSTAIVTQPDVGQIAGYNNAINVIYGSAAPKVSEIQSMLIGRFSTTFSALAETLESMIKHEATRPLVFSSNYYQTRQNLLDIDNLDVDKLDIHAYRYVMKPTLPIRRDSPKKAITLILAVLLGGMVGAGIVLGRNALRNYNAK